MAGIETRISDAFLLRACISQTPGFVLVEPNDYLPK